MKRKVREFVESTGFQNVVVFAIIACSVVLGVETFFHKPNFYFSIIDIGFTLFFIVEILLRIIAADSLRQFFTVCRVKVKKKKTSSFNKLQFLFEEKGFWNWFDTAIVVFSIIGLSAHWVEHPEFFVVSRLLRVSRIFRLLEISSELRNVERKIVSIIPTVFSFALLLGILIYIYSIIGVYLFGHKAFTYGDFSDLTGAALTLFQLMTLDNWSEIMTDVTNSSYNHWFSKGYFVSFIIFTAIISFNVFVAVLTSKVHEKFQEEDKQMARSIEEEIEESEEEILKNMNVLLQEIKELREEVKSLKNSQKQ
ncbi:MAG: ion transporter [Bacteroidota bacterium]